MRAGSGDHVLVTAHGYERLRCELEALRSAGRRELSERLRGARADGALSDGPALHELVEEWARLERRIALLEAQVATARVVEPSDDGRAGIATRVRVRDAATGETAEYDLVGAVEADAESGRVSVEAPVGRALVGHRCGDTVELETPGGRTRLRILDVRPSPRSERPRHEPSRLAGRPSGAPD
jgi:transcription elongation factor GreA